MSSIATPAATPSFRAGDRDRDMTADLLGQALAQGYLDMAEYESRLQTVYDARTTPDLRRLTSDLPVAELRRNDPRRMAARRAAARRGVHVHLAGYLAMVVIVLTVWLAVGLTAGSWYFWPVWPILGAGVGVLAHALPIKHAFPACPGARRLASVHSR
ncbi:MULTISPECIES: DUF1707 domain-containing protein [Mycolicibacterium]|jgi:hypothetical protein|uniref:Uncharacterized protein n=1 Tax=Mycolicibacterium vanbaalenii (strain DSM 7251 / JCM 13017 / BCRC 16820 / KCTC 9966 / NRRL B-24157 / PYR-1) TaxID=350058 RepID=A1T336_MYCVP|nr:MULTISPECIES: DUF1707 domain-containing protein [Mycolicibacterium]ABM11586.1 protein of unknown function DUF1707 [Mycolicibacterium vanbaalenii PYR-1]MCV7126334.1 DUF1707 domain-containing protein [Mycolicibacterium vanbaalenii PYR-1]MDW5613049.1 DUF1707 domain-containing protein [Mycolicibacterium sp. D5.8-2]QZT57565.1 DUF1707 domain-containing protein [Mycolicibacterium austroafricanum]UJL29492.1 DUF1707 domain-containing protein [Mycolicibacterium vanbaalenii]